MKRKRWNIHLCTPWNVCSMDGFRVHLHTPWYGIGIALNPAAKFCAYVDKPCTWLSIRKHD